MEVQVLSSALLDMTTETKTFTDTTHQFFGFEENDQLGVSGTSVAANKIDPAFPRFGGEWDYSIQINHPLDATNFMRLCNAVCGLPSDQIEKDILIATSRWKRSFEDSEVINNHERTDRNAWWTWQCFYANYLDILQDRGRYLIPTLRWSRWKTSAHSRFSRRFVSRPGNAYPEEDCPDENADICRGDALLGFITLLYLSPQLLQIPAQLGITNSDKQRRIGPTELPLYIIMNIDKIINSHLILVLEEKLEYL